MKTVKPKRKRKLTVNQKLVLHRVKQQLLSGIKVNLSEASKGIYSPTNTSISAKITALPEFQELLNTHLQDEKVAIRHSQLLDSTKMDHMVFPLGPEGEDEINLSGGVTSRIDTEDDEEVGEEDIDEEGLPERLKAERTTLTDKEIVAMLAEVNCTVRRIVHGQTARHVYFWTADNKARKDAIDMAYKIRSRYPKEGGNSFNFNFGGRSPEYKQ